jgi:GNAT superfamily N-acetyltransferase
MKAVECTTIEEIRGLASAFDWAQFEEDRADVHLLVVDDHHGPRAQCSLWWSQTPKLDAHRVGAIGHYSATNDRAAEILLSRAIDRLRSAGCTYAIGPMDGNTWRRYRFVTDAGLEPAFFLEPQNPLEWPQQFVVAGFSPIATYCSAINFDLARPARRYGRTDTKLRSSGVVVRSLRIEEVHCYLPRIYRLCCVAFPNNFLFADIAENDFIRLYNRILTVLRPELVIVAEQQTELVGFLFSVPDILRQSSGVPTDTFIIKTVAVLPRHELAGLGAIMVELAQQIGKHLGFARCIHALMDDRNTLACNISNSYARTMRRYTLYGKDL